jgi:hypothetical protein
MGNKHAEPIDFRAFPLGPCAYGEIVRCPACRENALLGSIVEVFRDYIHTLRDGNPEDVCTRREYIG